MLDVFQLTLGKVGMLLTFIAIGYILRRSGRLPEDTGRVLSLLTTMVFSPAYSIRSLSQNLTADKIGEKATLLGYGALCLIAAVGLAFLLAKVFARSEFERRSLTYAFTIPNYGYFGYPVVEGVFGSSVLADVILFGVPISIATNTFGYLLFATEGKFSWKRVVLSPVILAVFIGCALGLSGIKLPGFVNDVLAGAGNCMSPVSMLLAGFVLGAYPLKKLLGNGRSYLYSAMRLVFIPALFFGVMYLLGIRGYMLLIPQMILAMPLGLNLVVFPESCGHHADENATHCFVSYITAALVLPITFALLSYVAL